MKRVLMIAALLFAAACGQNQRNSAPANESVAETSDPATPEAVPALEGKWSVAAIDAQSVDAASAMIATFDGGKAVISSGCLRRAWTYTQKRNVVAFAPDPAGSANCGGGTTSQ